jgi:hypothetical protein
VLHVVCEFNETASRSALRRSDRNGSVDGSSNHSTPPRSNASSMKGCGSSGCRRAEVRCGSIATEMDCQPHHLRYSPYSDRTADIATCRKCGQQQTYRVMKWMSTQRVHPPSLGMLTLARGSPLLAFCRGPQTAVGYCRRGTLRYGPDREINYP